MVHLEAYFWRFTIHPADSETITFGMHKCIPYEIIVPFCIQLSIFITEGSGTDKSVPYERV